MNVILMLVHLGFGCKKPVQETPPPVIENPAPAVKDIAPNSSQLPIEILELSSNFQKVFFDLDSYVLSVSSQEALDQNVQIMQKNADIRLEIQGHADERGTTDYNLVLGQQRAESVGNYLLANGIAPSRIKVVSYGEEEPLKQGNSELAFTQNRRCEFVIAWGGESEVKGSDEAPAEAEE